MAEKKNVGALRDFQSQTRDTFNVPTFFKDYAALRDGRQYVLPYDFDFDLEDYLVRIDSITKTLEKIISITRNPVFKTDRKEVIKRSELVSSLDQQSFIETMKDSRLWRQKAGEMAPQSVHTFESIDTYVMYENEFICLLVNLIQEDLDDFMMLEEDYFSSIMESYEATAMTYSSRSFLNDFELFSTPKKRKFYDMKQDGQKFSDKLYKAKKMVNHIKSTELYKTVSKYKIKSNIIVTNILIHNPLYSYCYKYYISNYLNDEKAGSSLEKSYYNFVLLRMLEVLSQTGIDINDAKFSLADGWLNFSPISFSRNEVGYTISHAGKMAFKIDLVYKGFKTSSLVKTKRIVDKHNINSIVSDRKKDEDLYDNSIVVTASNKSNNFDKFLVCSYYKDDSAPFLNLFKSLSVMFELDSILKLCPVCGNKNVYSQNKDRKCLGCGSVMTYIPQGDSYILWMKSFFGKEG